MMTSYCKEAAKFGDVALPVYREPRHITIILNPIAGKEAGKNMFTKYAEPLFHCAGIKLSIVETESEGSMIYLFLECLAARLNLCICLYFQAKQKS